MKTLLLIILNNISKGYIRMSFFSIKSLVVFFNYYRYIPKIKQQKLIIKLICSSPIRFIYIYIHVCHTPNYKYKYIPNIYIRIILKFSSKKYTKTVVIDMSCPLPLLLLYTINIYIYFHDRMCFKNCFVHL